MADVIKINKGTGFNTVLNIDGNKINKGYRVQYSA